MFIYLDESGNLTLSNEAYFIVGTFTVDDPRRLINAFGSWKRAKFPKNLQYEAEVKFNDPYLSDDLRLRTLSFLAKQNIRIYYTYLIRKNIPQQYYRKGNVHQTGLLYTEIVAATLELYLPTRENELYIIRDNRSLKGVTKAMFNETVKSSLLPKLPAKTRIEINAVDSTTSQPIQVADWICGALARYHEKKPRGQEFYDVLKGSIVEEKELFSDYWTKRWKK